VVKSVRGSTDFRLVRLEPGSDLEAAREALLAEPSVQAVFYNYRYQPL
jgi:hypothetical protein